MGIEVRNITKTFGSFVALDQVSLTVPDGELVALLGPSGSGKTTLLRIIAGLEAFDLEKGVRTHLPERPGGCSAQMSPEPFFQPESAILFDGQDVARQAVGRRQVGFVFQHYALFRHMTVFDNIAFGLKVRPKHQRLPKAEIRDRVRELLRLIQLEAMENRYPSQLSGGQRQRVALARALAIQPKVLLLDEPFGALDAKVRQGLRRWLRRLHDEIHITSVFVTHDQEEALEVADRIVVMNEGRIEQVGTPDEVFHQPASAFVMDFLGNVNLFRGRVEAGKAVFGPLVVERARRTPDPGRQCELGSAPARSGDLERYPGTARHAGPDSQGSIGGAGGQGRTLERHRPGGVRGDVTRAFLPRAVLGRRRSVGGTSRLATVRG